jgi:hypothetical protein
MLIMVAAETILCLWRPADAAAFRAGVEVDFTGMISLDASGNSLHASHWHVAKK